MLYSLSHLNKKNNPNEIRCPINHLGDIFEYLKNNPSIRCNIIMISNDIPEYFEEQINFVKEVCKDYTICVNNFILLKQLLKEGYNCYIDYAVTDWEMFDNLKQLGVSDIYIDGPLGFQCECIKEAKTRANGNIKIRISPTVSPNAELSSGNNITSFYIRPEDITRVEYEEAFDIIDFHVNNKDTEQTLYEIYKRGSFNYNIQLLIKHINYVINNHLIRPEFAEKRTNCRQRCKMPQYKCQSCNVEFKFSDMMIDYLDKKS